MTEQEKTVLIETEQRSKSNSHRIDELTAAIKETQNEQKAIYEIATSVGVIAQRVTNIEEKVDDTNRKVDAQAAAWKETEGRLSDAQNEPYRIKAANTDALRMSVVSAVATFLATSIVGAILALILK